MPDRPSAPIDRAALETVAEIARNHDLVASVGVDDPLPTDGGHAQVVVSLDTRRYPSSVSEALLEIQWYENDDYNLHYRERRPADGERRGGDGVWQCRWDRHPNPHDAPRAHFHPPPEADPDPVEDPIDPADASPHVLVSRTLAWVRERIEHCWAVVED